MTDYTVTQDQSTTAVPIEKVEGADTFRGALRKSWEGKPLMGIFEKLKNKRQHPDMNYFNAGKGEKKYSLFDEVKQAKGE